MKRSQLGFAFVVVAGLLALLFLPKDSIRDSQVASVSAPKLDFNKVSSDSRPSQNQSKPNSQVPHRTVKSPSISTPQSEREISSLGLDPAVLEEARIFDRRLRATLSDKSSALSLRFYLIESRFGVGSAVASSAEADQDWDFLTQSSPEQMILAITQASEDLDPAEYSAEVVHLLSLATQWIDDHADDERVQKSGKVFFDQMRLRLEKVHPELSPFYQDTLSLQYQEQINKMTARTNSKKPTRTPASQRSK